MTSREVVPLDLRGTDAAQAAERVRKLVRDGPAELGRLLVLDDLTLLPAHLKAFGELYESKLVETLVCVAYGALSDREEFKLPRGLHAGQESCVIWVPDADGIDWRVGAPSASRKHRPDGRPSLLEILSVPEIFDRAGRLATDGVPHGVSIPGLHLAEAVTDEADFPPALLSAIDRLLGPAGPGSHHEPAPDIEDIFGRPAAGRVVLRERGPLRDAHDKAVSAVGATQEIAERLPSVWSLFRQRVPVTVLVNEAGERLAELRGKWLYLFDGAPPGAPLTPAQQKQVTAQGMTIDAPGDFDAARVGTAIERYVDHGLASGVILDELIDGLKDLERRLSADAGTDHRTALDRACPPSLIERLRGRIPFPPPEAWTPAAGFVATLLAGLAPYGNIAGAVLAVLWAALVALTVLRGPAVRITDQIGPIAANASAAVVGWGLGYAAGRVLAVLAPSPLWSFVPIAGIGVAAWALARSWRSRAHRWLADAELERIASAPEEMRTVADGLAGRWPSAIERTYTADALIRSWVAIGGVVAELRDRADRLRAAHRTGGRGPLAQTVHEHLTDLVRAALRPRWRELSTAQPPVHRENARHATAKLLAEWERHVAEKGPIEPPPFATEHGGGVSALPAEAVTAAQQAASYPAEDEMWQLCGAADLKFLDYSVADPPALSFAPRAARAQIRDQVTPGTVWVPSPRHAGVLRLVPIRPDLVLPWTEPDEGGTPS